MNYYFFFESLKPLLIESNRPQNSNAKVAGQYTFNRSKN